MRRNRKILRNVRKQSKGERIEGWLCASSSRHRQEGGSIYKKRLKKFLSLGRFRASFADSEDNVTEDACQRCTTGPKNTDTRIARNARYVNMAEETERTSSANRVSAAYSRSRGGKRLPRSDTRDFSSWRVIDRTFPLPKLSLARVVRDLVTNTLLSCLARSFREYDRSTNIEPHRSR